MHTKSKRNPIVALLGVENEIIVLLNNEARTENVAMATKYLIFWSFSHLVS